MPTVQRLKKKEKQKKRRQAEDSRKKRQSSESDAAGTSSDPSAASSTSSEGASSESTSVEVVETVSGPSTSSSSISSSSDSDPVRSDDTASKSSSSTMEDWYGMEDHGTNVAGVKKDDWFDRVDEGLDLEEQANSGHSDGESMSEDDDEIFEEMEGTVGKGSRVTASGVMKGIGAHGYNSQQLQRHRQQEQRKRSQAKNNEPMSQELTDKIYLGQLRQGRQDQGMVQNQVQRAERKATEQRIRAKDKADRATTEQVLDPRTRKILVKLLNAGVLSEVNGVVSTGKEANVYHALSEEYGSVAIKIYKTSILVFKDRDRYVSGDYRLKNGYSKSNPRKMVKVWAEKEMRNLKRLEAAGIPCPKVHLLRNHVLLMSFIGQDGWGAPRLKDTNLPSKRYLEGYVQMLKIMRTMYQVCKLVHADLSEYNILYMNKSLYIIDVSQAVEHEHPQAQTFLKKDCENVNLFFHRNGVNTLTLEELYDFVTDPDILPEEMDKKLEELNQRVDKRLEEGKEQTAEDVVNEGVFKETILPRSLHEIPDEDVEAELDKSFDPKERSLLQQALRARAAHTVDLPAHLKQNAQQSFRSDPFGLVREMSVSSSPSFSSSSVVPVSSALVPGAAASLLSQRPEKKP
eukprot:g80114.t1